jgi:small-conductance mechanosensitive channel
MFLLRLWTARKLENLQALDSDLYFSIFNVFREHGIEMFLSQSDLHLRTVDASIIHALPNKPILGNR